jgi:hypothetical protein
MPEGLSVTLGGLGLACKGLALMIERLALMSEGLKVDCLLRDFSNVRKRIPLFKGSRGCICRFPEIGNLFLNVLCKRTIFTAFTQKILFRI